MIKALKQLFFDKDLVNRIRKGKANPNVLYGEVISGKITLQEYIAATKK